MRLVRHVTLSMILDEWGTRLMQKLIDDFFRGRNRLANLDLRIG